MEDDVKFLITVIGVIVIGGAVVVGGLRSCATVDAGHIGVQTTFGRVSSETFSEGLSLKNPFSNVTGVSIQQTTINDETQCYTSDQQLVTVGYAALYRIPETNVAKIFREYPGDVYKNLIKPRVEESVKQVVALLKSEAVVKNRDEVKVETMKKVKEALGDLVTINDIVITNIDLSAQLEKAIEDKQIAEQKAFQMEYEKARAVKAAEIVVINAKAEAEAIQIKGDAITKSPSVIMLNAVEKWNGTAPATLVLDPKAGLTILADGPSR
ncbi:MAG: prohibitin family protein [Phycisphaerales bacterium]|nr:prohibitin family protein [Phycisphaerales bacterium]